MTQQIGALVIGQTPRPDLVDPLAALLPHVTIVQRGALDGLAPADLPDPAGAAYPLTTRLRDGQLVTVPESFLLPRLQERLDELEAEGILTNILLCAGTFAGLGGRGTLINPFRITLAVAQSLGLQKLGLIVPIPEQAPPVAARWQAAGFATTVWAADILHQDATMLAHCQAQIQQHGLDALLLDYVGYPADAVANLRHNIPVPLLDLGDLALRATASLIVKNLATD